MSNPLDLAKIKRFDPLVLQLGFALLAAIILLISWNQGYRPIAKGYTSARAEVAKLTQHISESDAMIEAAGGRVPWLRMNQQQLDSLTSRFAEHEGLPELLDAFIATFKNADIKLIDVSQGNLEPVLDSGKPLLIDGKPCYELSVTVTAEGRYHVLLGALSEITGEAFPGLVSVEKVELRRRKDLGGAVGANLQFNLYVIGTPTIKTIPLVPLEELDEG